MAAGSFIQSCCQKGYIMAKNKKRADGRYQKAFRFNGKLYNVCGISAADCDEKIAQKKQKLVSGLDLQKGNITLNKYYYEIYKVQRTGHVKAATEYTNDRRYKHISEVFGSRKITSIQHIEIAKFQTILSETLSVRETNLIISLLRSILQDSIDNGNIMFKNPAKGIRNLKNDAPAARDTIHRGLTLDEQQTFFHYAKQSWYYELFAFCLQTGIRQGEAAALEWSDCNFKDGTISISKTVTRISDKEFSIGLPKTRTSNRIIIMTDETRKTLESQRIKIREKFGAAAAFKGNVFCRIDGSLVIVQSTSNCIKYIIKQAEKDGKHIDYFAGHAFRHSYATRAHEAGVDDLVISKQLGHADVSLTQNLYTHVTDETTEKELSKLHIAI